MAKLRVENSAKTTSGLSHIRYRAPQFSQIDHWRTLEEEHLKFTTLVKIISHSFLRQTFLNYKKT